MQLMRPYSQRAVLLLYGIAGVMVYGKTLHYPMVFDDLLYLVGNPLFTQFHHFQELFTQFSQKVVCLAPLGKDGDISANFALRPLTYFSFFLNHSIGGLTPAGYRLFNILIHCSNAFLTFKLSRQLLLSPYFTRPVDQGNQGRSDFAAMAAGLIFLIHPLQIESVTYIIQRATSLSALFYLLTLVLHLEASRNRSTLPRILASVSVLCSMLSKESGFTAPFVAVLLEWIVIGSPLRTAIKNAAGLLILTPLVPLLLVAVSMSQSGEFDFTNLLHVSATQGSQSQSLPYALTQPNVWVSYLRLFFWPAGLNLDPEIPPVDSVLRCRFWLPVCGLLLVPAAAIMALRRHFTPHVSAAALLGFGWFALTIAPDSSVVPLPDLMAEHRSYLPLFGLCFFAGITLNSVMEQVQSIGRKHLAPMALLLPTTALCATTLQRNECWASKEKLWHDTCTKSPRKLRPWINLADAYSDTNRLPEAQRAIEESIAVQATGIAYANLSSILLRSQKPDEALDAALKALQCPPSGYDFFVFFAIGRCYAHLQRWAEAVPFLERALRASPGHRESAHILAVAHSNLGAHHHALEALESSRKYHPADPFIIGGISFCEAKLRELGDTKPPRVEIQPPSSGPPALEPYRLRLGFQ